MCEVPDKPGRDRSVTLVRPQVCTTGYAGTLAKNGENWPTFDFAEVKDPQEGEGGFMPAANIESVGLKRSKSTS
jgi:hypothetical protein